MWTGAQKGVGYKQQAVIGEKWILGYISCRAQATFRWANFHKKQ